MNRLKKIARTSYLYCKQFSYFIKGEPHAIGFILMLHRVGEWDKNKIAWNENMKVTPSKLDELLSIYEKKYDCIRLEEVPERLKSRNPRKFIAFTMDDGYKDNLTEALPVFKKHNIPFTIFLASDFMDNKAILWWYGLEELLLKHDSITLANNVTFPAGTMRDKSNSFLKIRKEILKIDQLHLLEGLQALFCNYNIDWLHAVKEVALSWNDVKILKHEPLVTLGAHTQHHYNLAKLPNPQDVAKEVIDGYHRLKEKAGIHPTVFAYPYGSSSEANNREFTVLKSMNKHFSLAVCANGGAITKMNSNLYALPRIMLENSFHKHSLLRTKDTFIL